MEKRIPNGIQEAKSVNASLATAIFVVILITFIELIFEVLKAFDVKISIFLQKITIFVILILFLREVYKNSEWIHEIEAFLTKANKRK